MTQTIESKKTATAEKIAAAITMRDVAAPTQATADKMLPTTKALVRANRITVNTLTTDGTNEIWVAVFHRTHNLVAQIDSRDVAFKPTADMQTATARREGFRKWIIEHSVEHGVFYDPQDRRTDVNRMPSKYDTDAILLDTAAWLVGNDVNGWCEKIANRLGVTVEVIDISGESITPITQYKERAVSPRYQSGAWAYATVDVVLTVKIKDIESYVTFTCNLVSGQLSKPKGIGDAKYGYHYQGLVSEIARDVAEVANAK